MFAAETDWCTSWNFQIAAKHSLDRHPSLWLLLLLLLTMLRADVPPVVNRANAAVSPVVCPRQDPAAMTMMMDHPVLPYRIFFYRLVFPWRYHLGQHHLYTKMRKINAAPMCATTGGKLMTKLHCHYSALCMCMHYTRIKNANFRLTWFS